MRSRADMDPEVWGALQYWISLGVIYARLPLREFFQLRVVCKEWNRLAGDRRFLETFNPSLLPKPHFCLCRRGAGYQLHGLLSYASRWRYECLGQHDALGSVVANRGLILSSSQTDGVLRVFNIHSRVWFTLPSEENRDCNAGYAPVVAIMVDTSSHPYEFQVIRVAVNEPGAQSPTHIYDSRTNAWSVRKITDVGVSPGYATCAQVSDAVYIWSELDYVLCYNIKEDRWYSPRVPDMECASPNWLRGVGAWKEKVYHVSHVGFGSLSSWFDIVLYVWEPEEREWAELGWVHLDWNERDRMPWHLRDYLTRTSDGSKPPGVEILTSYCDQWVLVWSYLGEEGTANRFVLYNVETEVWEIAGVPDGLVQPFLDDEESETYDAGSGCVHKKKARSRAMFQGSDDEQRREDITKALDQL